MTLSEYVHEHTLPFLREGSSAVFLNAIDKAPFGINEVFTLQNIDIIVFSEKLQHNFKSFCSCTVHTTKQCSGRMYQAHQRT